ncbi:MAG: AMP-binding protein [Alphaproteobacteria bacterium]
MKKDKKGKKDLFVELKIWSTVRANEIAISSIENTDKKTIFTYEELYKKIQSLSVGLLQYNLKEKPAVLLYEQHEHFIGAFLACLNSNILAIPLQINATHNQVQALQLLLKSSGADVVLTTHHIVLKNPDILDMNITVILTDKIKDISIENQYPFFHGENDVAYLQYSSGSTSSPKGCMITYKNLNTTLYRNGQCWEYDNKSKTLTWAPFSHAYGLVCALLLPLYMGTEVVIFPVKKLIEDPMSWLLALSKYAITHSGGPNFCYDLCIEKYAYKLSKELDLSHWKFAINAGDIVREKTTTQFIALYGKRGFNPSAFFVGYGMSELSGLISGKTYIEGASFISLGDVLENNKVYNGNGLFNLEKAANCGKLFPEMSLRIINPDTKVELESHVLGEICLSGESLFMGYWRMDNSAFFVSLDSVNYFRTGDLGCLIHNEIYLVGRVKDCILINGKIYSPKDIEDAIAKSLLELNLVEQCATIVFSVIDTEQEKLIIIQEVNSSAKKISFLVKAIRSCASLLFGIEPFEIVFPF